MSQLSSLSWARNVFMACLVLGGVGLVQSAAHAADLTTSTTPLVTVTTDTTSSTNFVVTPVAILATTTTPVLMIEDQNFVAVVGQPMTLTLHAAYGTAPYQWALISNGLPEGVFFNQETGQVVGSPGRTGHFTFTVQLRDAAQVVATKQLALDVYLADAVPATFPNASSTATDLDVSPVIIDLSNVTPDQVSTLVDVFPDTAPLIYVGPNAPTSILKINIAQMRIKPNGLYRIEGGTLSTVNESHRYSDVYYVDETGRRHAFPTEQVFKSWYNTEPTIESVPDWKIANIPLRENVTYRPGTVVRLENTQEYYRVLPKHTLKKFQDEATYQRLASAANPIPAGSPMATRVVSVLPLAQVADYTMDVNPITSMSDVPTLGNLPLSPWAEMQQM